MKTVLVFGISGFTGRHFQRFVTEHKLDEDFNFVGVTRDVDLSLENSFELIVQRYRPSYVVNFIGAIGRKSVGELIKVNALMSQRLLEACLRFGDAIGRILLIGSAAEYGKPLALPITEEHELRPLSNYGLSKVLQTDIANFFWRTHGLPIVLARPFNLSGPDLSPELSLGTFVDQIRRAAPGDVIKTGDLSARRDFISIDDAVRAYWDILMKGQNGEVYNVCSGYSLQMQEILLDLIRRSEKTLKIQIETDRFRKDDIPDIFGSFAKLQAHIGWEPKASNPY
ncbi:MAG: GDP-mannose 4,6-dehydratase [Pseudobdellovibrionaceae bacterium]|nr:GDP-mannose 4,6-dehydratase [Pseudobdellovibrionaceae bacterium]